MTVTLQVKLATVGQPGQVIGHRQPANFLLRLVPIGHVLHHAGGAHHLIIGAEVMGDAPMHPPHLAVVLPDDPMFDITGRPPCTESRKPRYHQFTVVRDALWTRTIRGWRHGWRGPGPESGRPPRTSGTAAVPGRNSTHQASLRSGPGSGRLRCPLRSVMSVRMATYLNGLPRSSRNGAMVERTQYTPCRPCAGCRSRRARLAVGDRAPSGHRNAAG